MFKLVKPNDPILTQPTQKYDFEDPKNDPEKLFNELLNLMIDNHGAGLSAPQVGLPHSVFVIGDPKNKDTAIGVFNPTIVDQSTEQEYNEEGCLTWPGMFVKVKRPVSIRARFSTWDGDTDTLRFHGYTACVFQHEFDHLQGITFQKRANRYHLTMAKNKYKKYLRQLKKRSSDSPLSKDSASTLTSPNVVQAIQEWVQKEKVDGKVRINENL